LNSLEEFSKAEYNIEKEKVKVEKGLKGYWNP